MTPHAHTEAIAAAELAVRLAPRDPRRHDRLARALLAAGTRLADADLAARTAISLDIGSADLHVTYALVAERLGRRGDARRALIDALMLDPQHAAARHELATLGAGRGRGWAHTLRTSGVEVPYTAGVVTLWAVAAGCATPATILLLAGDPASVVAGAALAAAGLYAVFTIHERRKITG